MDNRSKMNYKDYYEIITKIGKGSYGTVFKAKEKETNQIRDIKVIDINHYIDDIKNTYNEATITEEMKIKLDKFVNNIKMEIKNKCENDNINSVKIYEYFENEKEIAIVMELCDSNIREILKEKEKGFIPKEICEIITQLNNSFKKMKENQIVHRDIKLDNILIKFYEKAK